eukprot:6062691-Pyramimonas_sp.AAC.1
MLPAPQNTSTNWVVLGSEQPNLRAALTMKPRISCTRFLSRAQISGLPKDLAMSTHSCPRVKSTSVGGRNTVP